MNNGNISRYNICVHTYRTIDFVCVCLDLPRPWTWINCCANSHIAIWRYVLCIFFMYKSSFEWKMYSIISVEIPARKHRTISINPIRKLEHIACRHLFFSSGNIRSLSLYLFWKLLQIIRISSLANFPVATIKSILQRFFLWTFKVTKKKGHSQGGPFKEWRFIAKFKIPQEKRDFAETWKVNETVGMSIELSETKEIIFDVEIFSK